VSPLEDQRRLIGLFEACAQRLFAYARRHAPPENAEDLVAEAFEVAVRRLEEVPLDDGEAMAWLIGTVRRLAANQRRRRVVRERYWREAVREGWHATASSPEDAVTDREASVAALAALSASDRELVLLVAWDGLEPHQVAEVLGISRNALAVRLHRVRRRLDPGHQPRAALALARPTTAAQE
jgi:RNA polymerase sigma-70 factor (ECF subfamily)